jgi:exo-beta-1,3-glucanase (GH17 family)
MKTKTQQQIENARQAIRAQEAATRSEAINRYMMTQEQQGETINRLKFDLRLSAAVAVLITLAAGWYAVAKILGPI